MSQQQTIAKEIELSGKGLFTGEPATVRFKPAPPDSGVVFVRSQNDKILRVVALVDNVVPRRRRTSLQNGSFSVDLVEHCLSAVYGLGIDNLVVQTQADELTGMDGSPEPYAKALLAGGIVQQGVDRRVFKLTELVFVSEGVSSIAELPSQDPVPNRLYELEYQDAPGLGLKVYGFTSDPARYTMDLPRASTLVL